ncbi:MAG: aminomethyl transferase family protein [Desulfobacteraceae bacterium]|nr:aminomethyl transferase family protein [Desulfobacteraceae bacterium]
MAHQTPLHAWHTTQGAKMAEFGGYDMPLWYASAKQEHLSVLTAAGLFDTSHMAVVGVQGPDALALLQACFTKDLDACIGRHNGPIASGRCVYGAFLSDGGEVIDDAIVFKTADRRFLVVVNAGMGGTVSRHLEMHAEGLDVRVEDRTDGVGKIDLQGPLAGKILGRLVDGGPSAMAGMVYFSFKGHFDPDAPGYADLMLKDGTPVLLSRTGYTGEFGFEIFMQPDRVLPVWESVLSEGAPLGVLPCGLAARDSLRAGAGLPLSHQDIGAWPFIHHPWEFALPFTPDRSGFSKSFLGDKALLEAADAPWTAAYVGEDLRKVNAADGAQVLLPDGRIIGSVLTCATDMGIGRVGSRIYSIASGDAPEGFSPRGLCCGFVKTDRPLESGQTLTLRNGRRTIQAGVVGDIRPDRTARRPIQTML